MDIITTSKKYEKSMSSITIEDDPFEKRYLLLLSLYPECTDSHYDSYRDWSIKIGRQPTYDFLKGLIVGEIIDPNTSFIIAGNIAKKGAIENFKPDSSPITVFRFMKVMVESYKVLNDNDTFCIDDYGTHLPDSSILDV